MYYDDEYTTNGYNYGENQSGTDGYDTNEAAGAGQTQDGNGAQNQETSEPVQPSNLEYTAQVEVNEARERAEASENGQPDTTYRYTRLPYGEDQVSKNVNYQTNREADDARTGFGANAGAGADAGYAGAQSAGYDAQGTYGGQSTGYGAQGTYGGQSTGYGAQGTYGGQSAGSGAQGGYADQNSSAGGYAGGRPQKPKKAMKQKKQKKESGTGVRVLKFVGKCVAAALIFGVVAALTFNGVNGLLGDGSSASESETVDVGSLLSSASGDAGTSSTSTVSVGTATALDVSDVVDEVMPAIVSVTSLYEYTESYGFGFDIEESSSTYSSVGSGIIVARTDETLYIATNNHVVEDASSVSVTFVDDVEVSAEIKGTDSTNDLAVLSVSVSDMTSDTLSAIAVATLGDSDALSVGETTIAIGNALGYGQSVTTGIVSALNREVEIDGVTSSLIQTDAAINPGNSGGALLNAAGEVIGINSAKYADTDVEGMGYAIPINTAIPIINDLIEKEKVDESEASYLGIAGVDVSDEVSTYYNMPSGVYISQVISGTAAEEAGIQEGDILTAFDGKSITSMEELQSLMEYYAAGTTVEVTLQRANNGAYEEITLSVTLGSKNS